MFCLKESISDFVSRAESNEVLGFVCGEGVDVDAKDFDDFICEPLVQSFQCFGIRPQSLITPRVDDDCHVLHDSAIALNVMRQFSNRSTLACNVIDQNIPTANLDSALKFWTERQAFHWVCSGMVHLGDLDDVLVTSTRVKSATPVSTSAMSFCREARRPSDKPLLPSSA